MCRTFQNSWPHVCSIFCCWTTSLQKCHRYKVQRAHLRSRNRPQISNWHMLLPRSRPFQRCLHCCPMPIFDFLVGRLHIMAVCRIHSETSLRAKLETITQNLLTGILWPDLFNILIIGLYAVILFNVDQFQVYFQHSLNPYSSNVWRMAKDPWRQFATKNGYLFRRFSTPDRQSC